MTAECKKGHGQMILRKGVKGAFYGCNKYPECKETTQDPNSEQPSKESSSTPSSVFEAKDRTSIAQTAWNAAATVTSARISALSLDEGFENMKELADSIYKDINEKRSSE